MDIGDRLVKATAKSLEHNVKALSKPGQEMDWKTAAQGVLFTLDAERNTIIQEYLGKVLGSNRWFRAHPGKGPDDFEAFWNGTFPKNLRFRQECAEDAEALRKATMFLQSQFDNLTFTS